MPELPEGYLIERARPSDVDTLVEFNRGIARETEDRELNAETVKAGIEGMFAKPERGFYLVCRDLRSDDQSVVACLMVTFEWSDWRNGNFWWIQSVYVNKDHRGKRLFSALYDHVKELASEQEDVWGFRLYVEIENSKAQKVYKNSGMSKTPYLIYEQALEDKL